MPLGDQASLNHPRLTSRRRRILRPVLVHRIAASTQGQSQAGQDEQGCASLTLVRDPRLPTTAASAAAAAPVGAAAVLDGAAETARARIRVGFI